MKFLHTRQIITMKVAVLFLLPLAAFAEKLTVNFNNDRIWYTTPLRCMFSEPMVPMGFHPDSVPQGLSLTPPVRGRWSWSSQTTLQFSPESEWPQGNRYLVTIPAGVSSKISGNRLKHKWSREVPVGSFSGSFVNSTGVRSTVSFVEIRFKLRVHPDTLRKHLTCTRKSLLLYTSDSSEYRIIPQTGWRERDEVTLSVDTGLTPIDGNMHLESALVTDFIVSDTIKFLGLFRNDKKVSLSDSLFLEDQYELRFSHPFHYDAFQDYVTVNGVPSSDISHLNTTIDVHDLVVPGKATTLLLNTGLPSVDSAYLFKEMIFVLAGDSNRIDPALPSLTIKGILANYIERDSIPPQPVSLATPVRLLPSMKFNYIVKCPDTSSHKSYSGRVYCRTPAGVDTLKVSGQYLYPGNLPPNANCTLIVKAGYRIGRYQLKKDFHTIFRTGDYEFPQSCDPIIGQWDGYYSWKRPHHVMLPEAASVPLKRYGAPRIVSALRSVTKNEQLLSDTTAKSQPQIWHTDTIPAPAPGTDWYEFIPVPLSPVLSAHGYGAADVKLSVNSQDYEDLGRFVVTDLGIQLMKFRLSTVVTVTSLTKRAPVSGANVTLAGKQNHILAQGVTDTLGFFQVPRPLSPEFLIVSTTDDTLVYKTEASSFSDTAVYGGTIITERELYRPGDSLYFKGIVRLLRDRWEPAVADSAVVSIKWDKAAHFMDTLPLTGCGSFSGAVPVPSEIAHRSYVINAELLHAKRNVSGRFKVADFRLTELSAAIEEGIVENDSVKFTVSAKWLHGGIAGKCPFTWKLQVQTDWPSSWSRVAEESDNFESWNYQEERINHNEKTTWIHGSSVLDSTGRATVAFARLPDDSGKTYQFSATVEGSPVQSASASGKHIDIPPRYQLFVGIQEKTILVAGDTVPLRLKTVRENGQAVAGMVLTADIIHDIPLKRYGKNRFGLPAVIRDTAHTRVRTVNPVTDSLGIVRLSTQDLPEGNYTISIRLQTSLVKQPFLYEFTVSVPDTGSLFLESDYNEYNGYEQYTHSENDSFRIIELDAGIHSVGDTARYRIKAPQDSCNVLLTVTRENLYEHRWISMAGHDTVISIVIRDEHIPIVKIQAVFYIPLRKTSRGTLSFEQKNLLKTVSVKTHVSSEYRRIPVIVTTGNETYSPGDTVTVQITVPSKAASATATVMVVDEGVLQLGNAAIPDIMRIFTRGQGDHYNYINESSIRHFYGPFDYDSCNALRIRPHFAIDDLIGGLMGGDGAGLDLKKRGSLMISGAISLRTPVVPCAYFNPEVKFTTDGTALCRFKLPGNVTRWRVTAIVDDTTTFGTGTKNFDANKPLMIRPQIPRFLRVGDSASATYIVENYSKYKRQITSGAIVHGDTAIDTFTLNNDGMRMCHFPLIGRATGTDSLLFLVRSDTLSDGIKLGLTTIYEHPCDIAAIGGSTVDSTRIPIILPGKAAIDSGTLELSLSTTRMQNLAEGVQYLFNYPYGCLEQRSSKILPLLVLGDFARRFHLTMLEKGDELTTIQAYLDHTGDFQNKSDGGLGYWPSDSGNSNPWLTAFVLEIMTKAKSGGFAVKESVYKKAINYLKDQIHSKNSYESLLFYDSYYQLVMAQSGKPDRSALKKFYNEKNNLSVSAQINVLRAMYAAGNFKRKVIALQKQLQHGLVEKDRLAWFPQDNSNGFEFCHESPVRQTALALEALLETGCKSRFDEPMIRWLTEQRRFGRWRTTQENMAVFRAFAAYTTVYEHDFPKLDAAVSLTGSDWFSAKLQGREGTVAKSSRSLDSISVEGETAVSVSRSGSGRLYWDLKMSTTPSGKAPPVSSGLSITRRVVPLGSEYPVPLDSSSIEIGKLMKVTLTVRCDHNITFAAINDPVPAGCEAINPELRSGEQETARKNTRWSGPSEFSHREFRDSRVLLFVDIMPEGEYQFSYVIKSTTAGNFIWPAPLVEAMYHPEFYGRGAETTVKIVEKR